MGMVFILRLSTKDNAVSGWCDSKYFVQSVPIQKIKCKTKVTILARYEAKIAKICNFRSFRLVIQLTKHLFKNPSKSLSAQWSINVKTAVAF